jgi:acetyltransferase-like isoleucine patch superfamily enzyme
METAAVTPAATPALSFLRTTTASTTLPTVQVYVVEQGARIEPFSVAVDECPLGDRTFADARTAAIRAAGLAVPMTKIAPQTAVTGPALVVADDLWVTQRALRAFVQRARSTTTTTTTRLALPRSRLLELTLPLQDVDVDVDGNAMFPCAFVPAGTTVTAGEALARGAAVVVPYKEIAIDVPVPRALLGRSSSSTSWPLTSTVALRVRHWLHVLRASHLAPQVWLLDRATSSPVSSAWRALIGLRAGREARMAAWKRAFVFRGRNTVIHPTAVVEGSVIGDDVVIGPHALVLQSVVGDGCRIEQRAHVSQSTLGPRTFVSLNSSMQACVTFADADACANNLQACVVGSGVGLTSFVRALDTVLDDDGRPGGEVRVKDAGRLRGVGELPCGVAFGPNVYVGAGVTIAAGRSIAANTRVVAGDAGLLRRTDGGGDGTFAVVDGGLVPLRRPDR